MTVTEQDEKDVWSALGNSTDPTLVALRKKLSIHDFRTLFNLAWTHQYPPPAAITVLASDAIKRGEEAIAYAAQQQGWDADYARTHAEVVFLPETQK